MSNKIYVNNIDANRFLGQAAVPQMPASAAVPLSTTPSIASAPSISMPTAAMIGQALSLQSFSMKKE